MNSAILYFRYMRSIPRLWHPALLLDAPTAKNMVDLNARKDKVTSE